MKNTLEAYEIKIMSKQKVLSKNNNEISNKKYKP